MNWSLAFQSKCGEGVDLSQCLAGHGFTVSKSGAYKVGPGPQGEVRTGNLAAEELQELETALASTIAQATLRAESHDPVEAVTTEDTLSWIKGEAAPEMLIKSSGTDLTYRTQNAEEAKSLLNIARKLATKYYKTPFPDECNDGAAALQTLFNSMQTCTTDAECVYVDSALDIIAPNSTDELVTDDCSLIQPITTGNGEALRTNRNKLLESLDTIRGACGENIIRPDCTMISTIRLSGAAPTCQQGVCKASVAQ
jgi:hypothetical protein